MFNDEALLRLRRSLVELKVILHNTTDTRVDHEVDTAIRIVEQLLNEEVSNSPNSYKELLNLMGVILDKLPTVITLIRMLSG